MPGIGSIRLSVRMYVCSRMDPERGGVRTIWVSLAILAQIPSPPPLESQIAIKLALNVGTSPARQRNAI